MTKQELLDGTEFTIEGVRNTFKLVKSPSGTFYIVEQFRDKREEVIHEKYECNIEELTETEMSVYNNIMGECFEKTFNLDEFKKNKTYKFMNMKFESNNKLPLDIIQDMYLVASTVDQGYGPDHDVTGAEAKEKEYEQKYPNEYKFVNRVFTEDEYAGPYDEEITDEEALEVVGYTLEQIKGI